MSENKLVNDFMLDIETLGNTSNSVVIQVAACKFTREGKVLSEFTANVSQESCESIGFTTSKSTLKWWGEQNQNIFNEITTNNPRNVLEVMNDLYAFINEDNSGHYNIWSHATFDFPIIQNYMNKIGKTLPYRGARDIRTLIDLADIDLNDYDWSAKTHNALDDCKFQVMYCADAFRKLDGELK